jgi:hypothetical protein
MTNKDALEIRRLEAQNRNLISLLAMTVRALDIEVPNHASSAEAKKYLRAQKLFTGFRDEAKA